MEYKFPSEYHGNQYGSYVVVPGVTCYWECIILVIIYYTDSVSCRTAVQFDIILNLLYHPG